MRRILAISLMMLFSWTLIAPLLAPDADANLPACCRRNGKHHCMMRPMGQLDGNSRGFISVGEKCPCCPASACTVHSQTWEPEAAYAFFAEAVFHPASALQTEARSRISFLGSHPKRGPPSLLV